MTDQDQEDRRPPVFPAGVLSKAPVAELYKLAVAAAHDNAKEAAVDTLARLYAIQEGRYTPSGLYRPRFAKRVESAYRGGWNGAEDFYRAGRGGNFARPLAQAWRAGMDDRSAMALAWAQGRPMPAGRVK